MTFRARISPPRLLALDLTSMVDLVFLLVIFFLTTSTFIERNKARLNLPQDSTVLRRQVRPVDRSSIVINITTNGTIVVSQDYLTVEQLFARIAAELSLAGGDASRLEVLIRADRDAPLRYVNEIAGRLMTLGVDRCSLGTEIVPPEQAGKESPS